MRGNFLADGYGLDDAEGDVPTLTEKFNVVVAVVLCDRQKKSKFAAGRMVRIGAVVAPEGARAKEYAHSRSVRDPGRGGSS